MFILVDVYTGWQQGSDNWWLLETEVYSRLSCQEHTITLAKDMTDTPIEEVCLYTRVWVVDWEGGSNMADLEVFPPCPGI